MKVALEITSTSGVTPTGKHGKQRNQCRRKYREICLSIGSRFHDSKRGKQKHPFRRK